MTAEVEILITEKPDVLSVPVQAVLEFKGKDHVTVRTPNGYVRKSVTLGITNNTHVEVIEGVKPGDFVALNPMALMTPEEKREAFSTAGGGASKKAWGDAPVAKAAGPDGKALPGASPAEKGKGAGKGSRKGRGKGAGKGNWGGGAGGMDPAVIEKLKNASPEEKQKMFEQFKSANPGFIPGGGPGGGGQGGGGGFGGGSGS